MNKNIFISFYYEEDYSAACSIREYLKEKGYSVFRLENEKLEDSVAIKKWIDQQIEAAGIILVLVSEHTAKREFVLYEIKKALESNKIIIPINVTSKDVKNPVTKVEMGMGDKSLLKELPGCNVNYFALITRWIEEEIKNWEDCRIKYMDYLQEVINRMSNNQLIIKGSTGTLMIPPIISMLVATNNEGAGIGIVGIGIILASIGCFAWLDTFYLKTEKEFRGLYEKVCAGNVKMDLSMKIPEDKKLSEKEIYKIFWSMKKFYGVLGIIVLLPAIIEIANIVMAIGGVIIGVLMSYDGVVVEEVKELLTKILECLKNNNILGG